MSEKWLDGTEEHPEWWTCHAEGCSQMGGEILRWSSSDEEPHCPRCGGEMELMAEYARVDGLP